MNKISEISINDLKPYENNPRANDGAVEAVAQSIAQFGFKVPIVIDKNNIIVCGHTRYKAAKELGIITIPCVIADDLTPEQIKAFRLADNKVGELAGWDMELLEAELAGISDIDMSQFGFDDEIFVEDADVVEDDFEDELPEIPISKAGEIWSLGRHRLMIGDSTNAEDIKRLMNGAVADLVVTDPPYNVDYEEKQKSFEGVRPNKRVEKGTQINIENDKMNSANFQEFLTKAFINLKDSLKDGGAFYIWYAVMQAYNFLTACNNANLEIHQHLLWVKNHFSLSRTDYQWKHEPCLYGWKNGKHYFVNDRTQDTVFDDTIDFDKLKKDEAIELLKSFFNQYETTVLYEDKPLRNEYHPTMKPVNLFAKLIRNSSKKGEIILDIFGGSGTTIIACEQMERTAYLMEYEPKYADIIIKRFEEFTGQKAKLIVE